MKQEKIELLYTKVNSKRTGYRAGWVEGNCPFVWRHGGKDATPSFGIQINDKKPSRCHCWSCGYSGDLMDMVLDLSRYLKKDLWDGYDISGAMQLIANEFEDLELDPNDIPDYDAPPEKKLDVVFPDHWLASFQMAAKFPAAMTYLQSRGVPMWMVEKLDIRYDPMQKRIGFPFRNFKGELMGVQGRHIVEHSDLRYYQYGFQGKRNSHVWMGENEVDLDKAVILTEGPFDKTSIMRLYPNVLASFTSGLSYQKLMRVADAESIITFYDYGSGGDAAREAIHKYLPGVPITDLVPTEEEDDAGAMTVDQIAGYLKGHVKFTAH